MLLHKNARIILIVKIRLAVTKFRKSGEGKLLKVDSCANNVSNFIYRKILSSVRIVRKFYFASF